MEKKISTVIFDFVNVLIDLEIYHRVQSLINMPSDEILFIDDLEENVSGALDAGWKSVIHIPGTSLKETLKKFISLPE